MSRAFHGEIFAVLIGVRDDASDAVILIGIWKDGGENFFDFHFG